MTEETTVAALYIHGDRSPDSDATGPVPMLAMPSIEAVQGRGIRQDRRYFRPVYEGRERKRQVSLIDEGTIARHESRFGPIDRSYIKAQVILAGDIYLPDLIGLILRFEEGAELLISKDRDPCFQMDLIYPGLRAAMENGQQGALAMVTGTGSISVGQRVLIARPVSGELVPS